MISADRRSLLTAVLLFASGLLLGGCKSGDTTPPALRLGGPTMGTTWSLVWRAPAANAPSEKTVEGVVKRELDAVNDAMSTWKQDSELSRFNRAPATQAFEISAGTLAVLTVSKQAHSLSGGAFDPTVGPLVRAWGFGPDTPLPEGPSAETLEALKPRIGWDKLIVDGAKLRKKADGVELDLSAVAKGYAVDRVAAALEQLGLRDFLIEVGGELVARGRNAEGKAWQVAVQAPDAPGARPHSVLPLDDAAMATSGDYRNYREVGGKRISHTIDPRTRKPIEHGLASVSVIHADCAHADALATALNVLGPEAGPALAEAEGLAALFIVRRSDKAGFITVQSSALQALLARTEQAPAEVASR